MNLDIARLALLALGVWQLLRIHERLDRHEAKDAIGRRASGRI